LEAYTTERKYAQKSRIESQEEEEEFLTFVQNISVLFYNIAPSNYAYIVSDTVLQY